MMDSQEFRAEIARFDRAVETMSKHLEEHDTDIDSLTAIARGMEGKMDSFVSFAGRVGALEISMAKHSGICDERYVRISEHMTDSKQDRADMKQLIRNTGGFIIILLLGICGYFIIQFGLPGHPVIP